MKQVRVIYLEDFDEVAGLAVSEESRIRFIASERLFKPLERRAFRNTGEIAEAAYDVASAGLRTDR